jgi:hypothetical protein
LCLLTAPIHKNKNLIHTLAKDLGQLECKLQTWLVLPRLECVSSLNPVAKTLLTAPIHKNKNLIYTLAKDLGQLECKLQTWLVLT